MQPDLPASGGDVEFVRWHRIYACPGPGHRWCQYWDVCPEGPRSEPYPGISAAGDENVFVGKELRYGEGRAQLLPGGIVADPWLAVSNDAVVVFGGEVVPPCSVMTAMV